MRLSEAKVDNKLKIYKINIDNIKIKNYLICLGMVKNTIIKIIKKSIFNGPIIIEIRDYRLCISYDEAKNIEVDYI